MKKALSIFAALMLLCFFSPQAWAYYIGSVVVPSGQTIYYNIIDGKISITHPGTYYRDPDYPNIFHGNPWGDFIRPTGDLAIPDSIMFNNVLYPVTSIGGYAFIGCTGLTSITIPNGVTSIDSSAFSGCSGLTSINIPDSVTYIGGNAFNNCSGLTSINIPDGVTYIGGYAFNNCRWVLFIHFLVIQTDRTL